MIEAYNETVVDAPATVRLVHAADRCSSCGEEIDIEDEPIRAVEGAVSEDER